MRFFSAKRAVEHATAQCEAQEVPGVQAPAEPTDAEPTVVKRRRMDSKHKAGCRLRVFLLSPWCFAGVRALPKASSGYTSRLDSGDVPIDPWPRFSTPSAVLEGS